MLLILEKILHIAKYLELIISFAPFEISQKHLLNKAAAALGRIAVDETHYMKSMELMSLIEKWLLDLSMDVTGNVDFTKISPDSILKASGMEFSDDYDYNLDTFGGNVRDDVFALASELPTEMLEEFSKELGQILDLYVSKELSTYKFKSLSKS